jgi:hypothetical protein
MNNTSTNKKYNNIQPDPVKMGQTPGFVGTPNFGGTYKGQVSGTTGDQTFAKPMNMGAPSEIGGLAGTHNDIGELSGFITDGYLDKNNQAFGEAAKLNFLPPGMDISNQENVEIHNMPLRVYSGGVSYPADGWPNPRDIPE